MALGGARVPATISLKLGPDVGLFKGKVKSDDSACFENRKVRIVRISGQDVRVGKGYTDVNGKYAIQTTESSGDWIAKVKHEDIDGVQCKGASRRSAPPLNRAYDAQRSGTRTTRKPSGSTTVTPCSAQYGFAGSTGSARSRARTSRTLLVAEIEDQQRFRVRHRAPCSPPAVSSRCASVPGIARNNAVVAVVLAEPADSDSPRPSR